MLVLQRYVQSMAVMIIMIFSFAHCQENERRAVAEHQLMHDQGQAMQSLKRLMWLSNTIEGLHTAQIRTPQLDSDRADCGAEATQQFLSQLERGLRQNTPDVNAGASLWRVLWLAVHKPHLSSLPDSEK